MTTQTIIQNVKVYDGTGNLPFVADVLLEGTLISKIALPNTLKSQSVVDGTNLALAPGFIDTHSHSDLEAIREPALRHVISQGITTELVGQDGSSVAPLTDNNVKELAQNMAPLAGVLDVPYWWRSIAEYRHTLSKAQPVTRIEALIGHGTVRMAIMGSENRTPTNFELLAMQELVAKGLEEGALGVSFGLIYPPGSYAQTAELIAIAQIVKKYDGIIMAHMRNEQDSIQKSISEMEQVVRASGVRLHISHLKALGYRNWGKVNSILERIEQLRDAGFEITFDQYPYAATCTGLKVVVPIWAYAGGESAFQERLNIPVEYQKIVTETASKIESRGGASKIMIASVATDKNSWMAGQDLALIADKLGMAPADAALHILKVEGPSVVAIYFSIAESDVLEIMQNPLHGVCTDGIIGEHPHPRAFGAFPRFLGYYCRELGLLTLADAIKRITSVPAHRLRLWDRGLIREGLLADLVLFNPRTIKETNSYFNPKSIAQGVEAVWVNGKLKYKSN